MITDKYILDERGEPIPAGSLTEWAVWFEHAKDRVVKQEMIGDSKVSTVFLSLDHGYGGESLLWETMVFGGQLDQHTDRCGGSREQAESMHERVAGMVRKALNHDS